MPTLQEHLALHRGLVQRQFSAEERTAYAKSGVAMSDGSYPIPDRSALRDAIHAIGRAKDKAATKRHILKRARALSALGLIPPSWKMAQDDVASGGSAGLFDSSFGASCPTCGQNLGVGVKLPSSGKKFKTVKPGQVSLTRPMKQGMAIDPVHWVITAVVQSPDIPHIVAIDGEPVEVEWDQHAITQAAWGFLADYNQGNITMHHAELAQEDPDETECHGTLVQTWVTDHCFNFPPREDGTSQHVPQGSWLISYRAETPVLRQAILDGEVGAVSLTTFDWECEDLTTSAA